jgi:hypothetical protein
VEVPKLTGGDAGAFMEAVSEYLGDGRALQYMVNYITHDPDKQSPAHSLSPEDATGLLQEIIVESRRKAIEELISYRPRRPSLFGSFFRGLQDVNERKLIRGAIHHL